MKNLEFIFKIHKISYNPECIIILPIKLRESTILFIRIKFIGVK